MPTIRRRAKKVMRKKFKKTISLKKVDAIWKDYCEYAVTRPLIKTGAASLDNCTKLEIVGKRIIDDPRAYGLMSKGIMLTRRSKMPLGKLPLHRNEFLYKIKLTDSTFKGGLLYFKPDKKLSKRVHEALVNTSTYYRIEA